MTDLITRLRALADDWQRIMGSDHNTLREAADALEWQVGVTKALQERCDKQAPDQVELQQELDDLKAKLAWWKDRAVKLRYKGRMSVKLASDTMKRDSREIASLKAELADVTGKLIDQDLAGIKFREEPNRGSWMERAGKAEAEAADFRELLKEMRDLADKDGYLSRILSVKVIDQALSQPGPGAQLLERVRTLEAELAAWKVIDGSAYVARVEKLEAVAALSEVHVKNGGMTNAQRLADALAALNR